MTTLKWTKLQVFTVDFDGNSDHIGDLGYFLYIFKGKKHAQGIFFIRTLSSVSFVSSIIQELLEII